MGTSHLNKDAKMPAIILRYLPQILCALFVTGLYLYWQNKIYDKGYNAAVAEYEKRDIDTARQSEALLKRARDESDAKNKQTQERLTNAAKIYAKHYDDLRSTPVIERVLIRTKAASCDSNTMPGAAKGGQGTPAGSARVGQAELPSENLRELNKVIADIERMALKCELLLNTVE